MAKIVVLSGSFTFNGIVYAFTNCAMNVQSEIHNTTDQNSGIYDDFVAGVVAGDFTLDLWRHRLQILPIVGGLKAAFSLIAGEVEFTGFAACIGKSDSIVIETLIKTQLIFKTTGVINESAP